MATYQDHEIRFQTEYIHKNKQVFKAMILKLEENLFKGIVLRDDLLLYASATQMNEANARLVLNNHIRKFNHMHDTKIPELKYNIKQGAKSAVKKAENITKDAEQIAEQNAHNAENIAEQMTEEKAVRELPVIEMNAAKIEPVKGEPTQAKPRRKPFTPYGLNGYLVDKNGNIRLHLDRRASAATIVLTKEMFAMLSDMVKATQEQQQ